MPTLISMAMSKAEAKQQCEPCCTEDAPKYPWGLTINLDDAAMKKLGVADMKAGQEMTILAKAVVTSTNENQMQDGDKECSCSLQITDMQMSGLAADAANVMYGEKKS